MLKNRIKTFDISSKGLILILLLLAGTQASAAPTVNNDSSFVTFGKSMSSGMSVRFAPEVFEITQYPNYQLAGIAAEFIKPPIFVSESQSKIPAVVEFLPPTPAALLMTLTGFLCISFVRDRRAWWMITAGLLCVGQAGVDVVPKLVRYIHKQHTKQACSQKTAYIGEYENSFTRCDVEETKYMGLLHYLAGIPDDDDIVVHQRGRRIASLFHIYKTLLNKWSICAFSVLAAIKPVIIQRLSNVIFELNCFAPKADQFIYSNPRCLFLRSYLTVCFSRSEGSFRAKSV